MGFNLTAIELAAKVAEAHQGNEELHRTVGLFFAAFGNAEHQLTRVFAHILGYRNFETFDFLANGMDLRAKCQQLKKAARLYSPMGPNIEPRIDYFNKQAREARNSLAHNRLILDTGSIRCIHLGVSHNGKPDDVRPSGQAPASYPVNYIHQLSLWLLDFAEDLNECAVSTWNAGPFEVASPRSVLPQGCGQTLRRKAE